MYLRRPLVEPRVIRGSVTWDHVSRLQEVELLSSRERERERESFSDEECSFALGLFSNYSSEKLVNLVVMTTGKEIDGKTG